MILEGVGSGAVGGPNLDGMKCDGYATVRVTGLVASVLTREGEHPGTVALPELVGNLCWGGDDMHTLLS